MDFSGLTIYLNNNRFNHNRGHVFFCKQLPCGEILTVINYAQPGLLVNCQTPDRA